MSHPLDNPVLASLAGAHASLAVTRGRAARYPADVSPFCALPADPAAADWADAARLVSPGESVAFPGQLAGARSAPPGWEVDWLGGGVQLTATALEGKPDEEALPLGPADVGDMLRLTELTKPGPFLHAVTSNITAIRLYEELGFTLRREITFPLLRFTGAAAVG